MREEFYAENMIEIKGQNGIISSARYMEFKGETSEEWKWKFVRNVDAASGLKEVEASVDAEPLRVCFHVVDWDNNEDDSLLNFIGNENTVGSRDGEFTTVDFTGESGKLGWSVAVGNINNDNYPDAIVGAPDYNSQKGRVFVYYGGNPMNNVSDIEIPSPHGYTQQFGFSLAVGDFDGQGDADDILVGAPKYDSDKGRVYIFYDGATTPDVTISSPLTYADRFGFSVASGDFDNEDDKDDVVVGAPHFRNGNNRGRVYIFYDGNTDPDIRISASGTGCQFGYSIGVGNFDGQSDADDLVVGAPTRISNKGGAYIFYDGGEDYDNESDADVKITPGDYKQKLGFSIASGNFDGDGNSKDDLLVGAPTYPDDDDDGRAYIYYNGTNTVGETFSAGSNKNFGWSVASGDFNNEGTDDALIGAPKNNSYKGCTYIYYGEDADMDWAY
ncbi:MAG: FG-GAP repeat protein, partial [Thermoplasmata archaeon]|nr:FG-GAP repeat protein [Thermoplasmata archaeon]